MFQVALNERGRKEGGFDVARLLARSKRDNPNPPFQQMATGKPRCRVVCAGSSVIVTFKFDALLARRGHANDVPLTHNTTEAADPSPQSRRLAHPPTQHALSTGRRLRRRAGGPARQHNRRNYHQQPGALETLLSCAGELVLTWDLDSYGASTSPSRRLSRGSSPSSARNKKNT